MIIATLGLLLTVGQSLSDVARSARAAGDSCALVVQSQSVPGQLVAADGLRFCLPSDWQRAGAMTWQGAGVIRVDRRAPATRVVPIKRPRAVLAPRDVQPLPWSEDVGGETVDFFVSVADAGRWQTRATWDGVLTFTGDAPTAFAKELHLAIFRSVRLDEP